MKTRFLTEITVGALMVALTANLHAQTPTGAGRPATPPVATVTDTPAAKDQSPATISIAYEAFSLPVVKAGELQRKGLTDAELYREVIGSGKIERLLILRTKSGARAVLDNVSNYIYPTEFTQPQIPVPKSSKETPTPLPVAATSFEKRDVGDTMEVEPTLSEDRKSVDFQVAVQHVAFVRREKWGREITLLEQPLLETQRFSTNVTALVGSPRLVGTANPPFGNGLVERTEQNVWFCFITATVVQNNAAPQKAGR